MVSSDEPRLRRRRLLQALGAGTLLLPTLTSCAAHRRHHWEAWRVFRDTSISDDGRVIDHSQPDRRSTSEGQAYALFFALVDDDHALFQRLLDWTRNNLAGGDLAQRLPAWLWGHDAATNHWRVLDENAASDADLWIAYCLIEAAERWDAPNFAATARALLSQVRDREVVRMPGMGAMLLPAPLGFAGPGQWRLNPSYLPVPLLRRVAGFDPGGPWEELASNTLRLLRDSAPRGYAPDWVAWSGGRVAVDPVFGAVGSYNAIRTYLWAGMTHPRDPAFRQVLAALRGPSRLLLDGRPMPEQVDTLSGEVQGTGPYGFQAAMLPYLHALGARGRAAQIRAALPTPAQQRAQAPAYYSQMLMLFGAGWHDRRFGFGRNGELQRGR